MKKDSADEVLASTPLTSLDAARLIMECVEESDNLYRITNRQEVMSRIRKIIQRGLQVMRAEEHTVTLETAAWRSVEARASRRAVTLRDLRHFVRRILRVPEAAQLPLRTITVRQCRYILTNAFSNSPSSYRKGRAILHSIFQYGMRCEWCDANPVALIEVPKPNEKPIRPLNVDEIKRLRNVANRPGFRDMRLPLQLMLYCGVRPTEVTRIKPEDIHWQDKELWICPATSKTGGGRVIPLRNIDRPKATSVAPKNWEQRWKALRQAAGFTQWQADVCRHTFASYHAAYFNNMSQLQMEMGHRDLSLLRTRYVSPVRRKDAKEFWSARFPKWNVCRS